MNNVFNEAIETWYRDNQRDLPWRNTHDPYAIWLSEIILQQTRVAQGYDYYLRFIDRFPTVNKLALADEDEVLLLWQGLGYYSRARNLHKAAKVIHQSGHFPADFQSLRKLPGVGDYTAAAIASFAYGEPCAVLDGNVYRVLSRYLGIEEPIDTNVGKKTFRALADEMLDDHNPALYNQAIMDFGALVCTPKTTCLGCPLSETCQAYRTASVALLPRKSRSVKVTSRHLIYIYARKEGQILLHRRGPNDIWQGLYEPLMLEAENANQQKQIEDMLKNLGAVMLKFDVRHQLTHQSLHADFYRLEIKDLPNVEQQLKLLMGQDWLESNTYFWCKEEERDSYAVSRLVQELYKIISL